MGERNELFDFSKRLEQFRKSLPKFTPKPKAPPYPEISSLIEQGDKIFSAIENVDSTTEGLRDWIALAVNIVWNIHNSLPNNWSYEEFWRFYLAKALRLAAELGVELERLKEPLAYISNLDLKTHSGLEIAWCWLSLEKFEEAQTIAIRALQKCSYTDVSDYEVATRSWLIRYESIIRSGGNMADAMDSLEEAIKAIRTASRNRKITCEEVERLKICLSEQCNKVIVFLDNNRGLLKRIRRYLDLLKEESLMKSPERLASMGVISSGSYSQNEVRLLNYQMDVFTRLYAELHQELGLHDEYEQERLSQNMPLSDLFVFEKMVAKLIILLDEFSSYTRKVSVQTFRDGKWVEEKMENTKSYVLIRFLLEDYLDSLPEHSVTTNQKKVFDEYNIEIPVAKLSQYL